MFARRNVSSLQSKALVGMSSLISSLLKKTLLFLPLVCILNYPSPSVATDKWPPVDPGELRMTSEPKALGAHAIFLYRQLDQDCDKFKERYYVRIKILTEEGRAAANIEIPFIKGRQKISNIEARTISQDGTVTEFDGQVYENMIVKNRQVKVLAKTFTLPNVQVGSVIEYRYVSDMIGDPEWTLSGDLFTKYAKFSLKQNRLFKFAWRWQSLPDGTSPPVKEGGYVRMEVRNIPAFQREDFMPPPEELRPTVTFVGSGRGGDPDTFWRREAHADYEWIESFVNMPAAMHEAVATIVLPDDQPEVKLQKIYARVQQFRNTSYEEMKSEKELKRDKEPENRSVEDVWKNQRGGWLDLNRLFLALAQAAGFEAYAVLVSTRDKYFFKPELRNPSQLNYTVILIKIAGEDRYFDPGTEFTPYGYLPWAESSVRGLRLDKEGGNWVNTNITPSSSSVVSRTADLKLSETGGIEGALRETCTGLEALWRRMEERNEDDAARKKFLEDDVKEWVPPGFEVELRNGPDWKNSAVPFVAEFSIKAENWAVTAGRRMLIPIGFFVAYEKTLFVQENRIYPVYYHFPHETRDEVNLDLTPGWVMTALPADKDLDQKLVAYKLRVENRHGSAHITRVLKVDFVLLDAGYYGALRSFFQQVRSSDEEQIVAQPRS